MVEAKAVTRFLVANLGLFVVLVLYSAGGAWLFRLIERGSSLELRNNATRRAGEIETARRALAVEVARLKRDYNPERESIWTAQQRIAVLLDAYQSNVAEAIALYDYDGTAEGRSDGWQSFFSALMFTVSTNTLIGYGHVTPTTQLGQILLIPYALFGVPLTLIFVAQISSLFTAVLRFFYERLCCALCINRRERTLQQHGVRRHPSDDGGARRNAGDEEGDDDLTDVPLHLIAFILVLVVFGGGLLFAWWDELSTATGVYVAFVSLTTIGFGDFVPGFSSISTTSGKVEMLLAIVYCVLGLSILGMGIGLVINKFVIKSRNIARKIGLVEKFKDADGDGVDDGDEGALRAVARFV